MKIIFWKTSTQFQKHFSALRMCPLVSWNENFNFGSDFWNFHKFTNVHTSFTVFSSARIQAMFCIQLLDPSIFPPALWFLSTSTSTLQQGNTWKPTELYDTSIYIFYSQIQCSICSIKLFIAFQQRVSRKFATKSRQFD